MGASLAWLYWDPKRIAFYIPFTNRPVAWYGLCFVFGFVIAYLLIVPMFKSKLKHSPSVSRSELLALVDKLTWWIVAGTIIGARLGHVLFYEWPRYQTHLIDVFKVWEGGLASHGGAVGVILAIYVYYLTLKKTYPELTFLTLLDLVAVPTAFVGCCIRFGNFINQEILGKVSTLPFAIVFGHPADGSFPQPRHPVQLYEAAAYLTAFFVLYSLWWAKEEKLKAGFFAGLFFILIFGSRFFIEFWKAPQSLMMDESFIQTGQLLSIPFVVLGIFLIKWGHFLEKPRCTHA